MNRGRQLGEGTGCNCKDCRNVDLLVRNNSQRVPGISRVTAPTCRECGTGYIVENREDFGEQYVRNSNRGQGGRGIQSRGRHESEIGGDIVFGLIFKSHGRRGWSSRRCVGEAAVGVQDERADRRRRNQHGGQRIACGAKIVGQHPLGRGDSQRPAVGQCVEVRIADGHGRNGQRYRGCTARLRAIGDFKGERIVSGVAGRRHEIEGAIRMQRETGGMCGTGH